MAPTISVLPCQKRPLVHFLFPITFLGKLKKMSLIWSYCCFMLYSSTYLFSPVTGCYLRGFCAYEMTTYVRSISYMPILFCTRCYTMHSQILVKKRFTGSTCKVKGHKRTSCERITFRVLRDKVHIFRELFEKYNFLDGSTK